MPLMQTRRRFLTTLSLAGAAGLVRARPALAAEGPPEITSVRIQKSPSSYCHQIRTDRGGIRELERASAPGRPIARLLFQRFGRL